MSIADRELSVADGSPLEFYEFVAGTQHWRWTNAATALPLGSYTWQPTTISRGQVKESDERSSRDIVIHVPRDNTLAVALLSGQIDVEIMVRVYTTHYGEGDADILWQGRVSGVAISGSEAEIRCSGLNAYTDRRLPHIGISRTCPLMLYDTQCGVNRSSFLHSATVEAIDGRVITVSGAPHLDPEGAGYDATYYVAGTLQFLERTGFIEATDGDEITLMTPLAIPVGATVQLSAGCDRTFATCRSRFANSHRFFGFSFLPLRNPFDGRFA